MRWAEQTRTGHIGSPWQTEQTMCRKDRTYWLSLADSKPGQDILALPGRQSKPCVERTGHIGSPWQTEQTMCRKDRTYWLSLADSKPGQDILALPGRQNKPCVERTGHIGSPWQTEQTNGRQKKSNYSMRWTGLLLPCDHGNTREKLYMCVLPVLSVCYLLSLLPASWCSLLQRILSYTSQLTFTRLLCYGTLIIHCCEDIKSNTLWHNPPPPSRSTVNKTNSEKT
jgi:hypothetical protein